MDLSVPGGGAGWLLAVEPGGPGPEALSAGARERLAAFGFAGAQVDWPTPDRLRVKLPGLDESGVERATRLLLGASRLAFTPVVVHEAFFEGLRARLPADGVVRLEVDRTGAEAGIRLWYLSAVSEARLRVFLGELSPPQGTRLVLLGGPGSALATLVADPPEVMQPVLTEVVLRDDGAGGAMVVARPAAASRAALEGLLARSQDRPVAILVDGELAALPLVLARQGDAEIQITPSPLVPQAEARAQAERLAAQLKPWGLNPALRLVERRLTPKGG